MRFDRGRAARRPPARRETDAEGTACVFQKVGKKKRATNVDTVRILGIVRVTSLVNRATRDRTRRFCARSSRFFLQSPRFDSSLSVWDGSSRELSCVQKCGVAEKQRSSPPSLYQPYAVVFQVSDNDIKCNLKEKEGSDETVTGTKTRRDGDKSMRRIPLHRYSGDFRARFVLVSLLQETREKQARSYTRVICDVKAGRRPSSICHCARLCRHF
jgi:hypothetical protein